MKDMYSFELLKHVSEAVKWFSIDLYELEQLEAFWQIPVLSDTFYPITTGIITFEGQYIQLLLVTQITANIYIKTIYHHLLKVLDALDHWLPSVMSGVIEKHPRYPLIRWVDFTFEVDVATQAVHLCSELVDGRRRKGFELVEFLRKCPDAITNQDGVLMLDC